MDDVDAEVTTEQPAQLEFFELPAQKPVPRRSPWQAMGRLSLRYDHAVLALIGGLIGCSVVFAFGVERGKRLAQAEQNFLDSIVVSSSFASKATPSVQTAATPKTSAKSEKAATASGGKAAPTVKTAPTPGKKLATPKAVASTKQFAIQVVSYRQQPLAQRELQRLKQRGETAFLVTKHEQMALVVGPFSTKAHAATKLTQLKQRYQDCFIRIL